MNSYSLPVSKKNIWENRPKKCLLVGIISGSMQRVHTTQGDPALSLLDMVV